jgi:hypothetical protein
MEPISLIIAALGAGAIAAAKDRGLLLRILMKA